MVPLAYIVALIAMVFTAISYGRMTRVYPSAGSAYTYASEVIHPNVGFLVGWSSLLDYLLLPMVNAVIGRIYFESFFPDTPSWIFVLVYVAIVTALNAWSIKGTSNINGVLVVFQIVLIGVFLVLDVQLHTERPGPGHRVHARTALSRGREHGRGRSRAPRWSASRSSGSTRSRCTARRPRSPSTVPKAIVLALLIGGAIFFLGAWFAQAAFPTLDGFEVTDDTLPELALKVGGEFFKILFVSAAPRGHVRVEPVLARQRLPHDLRHGPQSAPAGSRASCPTSTRDF